MKQVKQGVILEISVKTGSRENSFNGDVLKIKSQPREGKANREIITYLRKFFGKEIAILSGLKSKKKVILIQDAALEEVREKLEAKPGQ